MKDGELVWREDKRIEWIDGAGRKRIGGNSENYVLMEIDIHTRASAIVDRRW